MANRLVGNVYILDDAGLITWGNSGLKVKAVGFFSTNSTGKLELYIGSTANVVVRLQNSDVNNGANPTNQYLGGINLTDLGVKTITAGTGFLYLV